jgi:predicted Zn-ribbon and HTH transcriptional regulator
MQPIDVQQEYNRLSQAYREMRDEELENVAAEACDLTDVARECLSFEISSRGLKIPLNLECPPEDEPEALPPLAEGFVPDDGDLTPVATVNDMDELLCIHKLLAEAGFECFLGDEKVRDPKDLHDDFSAGVEIKVWNAEEQRALGILAAQPAEAAPNEKEVNGDSPILCPKCKSDGVIFEERAIEETGGKLRRSSKFRWRCDDCGYEWEDDGITP